jgi:hypothetical protein
VTGSFSLDIPANAVRVNITVAAPTRVLQAFSETLPPDNTVRLTIQSSGGTLAIAKDADDGPTRVTQNGVPVPFFQLLDWAAGHNQKLNPAALVFPNLASGSYQVCVVRAKEPVCKQGILVPHGTLNLRLP